MLDGTVVKLIDSSGTLTSVTIADVNQILNGVIHVIDAVILPAM